MKKGIISFLITILILLLLAIPLKVLDNIELYEILLFMGSILGIILFFNKKFRWIGLGIFLAIMICLISFNVLDLMLKNII